MSYTNSHYLVETDWLEANLSEPNLRIVDVRVDMDVASDGGLEFAPARNAWEEAHIPGATFIDFRKELSSADDQMFNLPPANAFSSVMSSHGIGSGTRVVAYDGFMNMWAARLFWMLRAYGFEDVSVLNGGWQKWTQEGRPTSNEPPSYPQGSFAANGSSGDLLVDKHVVLAAIDSQEVGILDVLSPDYFAGQNSFRSCRAGHIPSAENVPFFEVVDPETHAYLPADVLETKFAQAPTTSKKRVITYCGAGIAASGVALALALVGKDVGIYDGSLFEWAADPSLPLETGG